MESINNCTVPNCANSRGIKYHRCHLYFRHCRDLFIENLIFIQVFHVLTATLVLPPTSLKFYFPTANCLTMGVV